MSDMSDREKQVWADVGVTPDELHDMKLVAGRQFNDVSLPAAALLGDMLVARAMNNVAAAIREQSVPAAIPRGAGGLDD